MLQACVEKNKGNCSCLLDNKTLTDDLSLMVSSGTCYINDLFSLLNLQPLLR